MDVIGNHILVKSLRERVFGCPRLHLPRAKGIPHAEKEVKDCERVLTLGVQVEVTIGE